jgi:hypothetical protein
LKIDSKVIASQMEKECMARDATLEKYLAIITRMENYFKRFTVEHIERAKNIEPDKLAKVAARKATLQLDVFFQTIKDPSVKAVEPEPRMVNIIEGEDWRAPIMAYLHHHYELDNNIELLRMQQRAKAYQVIGDELYKTLVTRPLLRLFEQRRRQRVASTGTNTLGRMRRSYRLKNPCSKGVQAGFLFAFDNR